MQTVGSNRRPSHLDQLDHDARQGKEGCSVMMSWNSRSPRGPSGPLLLPAPMEGELPIELHRMTRKPTQLLDVPVVPCDHEPFETENLHNCMGLRGVLACRGR